jgi:IS5 family transposase
MNMDGRLGRNPLKGAIGDAVLFGASHNIRMLLKKLRLLWAQYGLKLRELLRGYRPVIATNYFDGLQLIYSARTI